MVMGSGLLRSYTLVGRTRQIKYVYCIWMMEDAMKNMPGAGKHYCLYRMAEEASLRSKHWSRDLKRERQ